jgi:hypothetical protein
MTLVEADLAGAAMLVGLVLNVGSTGGGLAILVIVDYGLREDIAPAPTRQERPAR